VIGIARVLCTASQFYPVFVVENLELSIKAGQKACLELFPNKKITILLKMPKKYKIWQEL